MYIRPPSSLSPSLFHPRPKTSLAGQRLFVIDIVVRQRRHHCLYRPRALWVMGAADYSPVSVRGVARVIACAFVHLLPWPFTRCVFCALSLSHSHSFSVGSMCVLYALVCVRVYCKFNLILFKLLLSFVFFMSLYFRSFCYVRSFLLGCSTLRAACCLLDTFFLRL